MINAHILLIADGRSPTTRSWIRLLSGQFQHITLVSSYVCDPPKDVDDFELLPLALARWSGSQAGDKPGSRTETGMRRMAGRFRAPFLRLRNMLGLSTLPAATRKLAKLSEQLKPDLVHALRIPFEGMAAMGLPGKIPLAVSVWGNDLTFHAHTNRWMMELTKQCLIRADGLAADTRRDLRLGASMGSRPDISTLLAPGGGGVDLNEIDQAIRTGKDKRAEQVPSGRRVLVNPRGFRPGSVRNDVFFEAIRLAAQALPDLLALCPGMKGQIEAENALERLGLHEHLLLMPRLSQPDLWHLFSKAELLVSVSQHDGTPNSFLEGIACGLFPVTGDIESMREWIRPGVNGLLAPPDNPEAVCEAVLTAMQNFDLRKAAAEWNQKNLLPQVDRKAVRERTLDFYGRILR